ncbi:UNVERIFIED_CONTAM: Mitochondrial import inner membrane translocase subunit PAM16 like 1 [Sesamum calycinum]|uniref:Mitochondrial import inner membrane translocase subunit PAM16 like 1 n=1 Tax=Sesamum calycinum TaxID=2727403 RepID=A0AAW2NGB1_9LAMI
MVVQRLLELKSIYSVFEFGDPIFPLQQWSNKYFYGQIILIRLHALMYLRTYIFTVIMAARLLANLIVMGSGIMARAFVQAYRQALANASKNGVAQEAANNIRRGSKMTEAEARQILGVTEHSSWEEILKRYNNLFEQECWKDFTRRR